MPETSRASSQASTQQASGGLLDQIVKEGRFTRDTERGKDMIKQFVDQILQGAMTVSKDTESTINARIAQIDKLISAQLNEILHTPQFQKLEASWRGLKYLDLRCDPTLVWSTMV